MAEGKRIAIYARVQQTDVQDVARLPTPLLPTDAARVFLSANGWDVVSDHIDSLNEFTQWEKVLDMARKRLIDVIAFPTLSDVPLSAFKMAHITEDLRERGVSYILVTDMVDTSTSVGQLMFTIMLSYRDLQRQNG